MTIHLLNQTSSAVTKSKDFPVETANEVYRLSSYESEIMLMNEIN